MKQGSSRSALSSMTDPRILLVLITLAFGSLQAQANCDHTKSIFRCVKFVKNYDGDTITVSIPSVHPLLGEKISVRVLGIDAPEMRSDDPCERQAAAKARDELTKMLEGADKINLRSIGRDKYFRVLAEVEVDGKDMAEEMIKSGLAVPYDGGAHPNINWCHRN